MVCILWNILPAQGQGPQAVNGSQSKGIIFKLSFAVLALNPDCFCFLARLFVCAVLFLVFVGFFFYVMFFLGFVDSPAPKLAGHRRLPYCLPKQWRRSGWGGNGDWWQLSMESGRSAETASLAILWTSWTFEPFLLRFQKIPDSIYLKSWPASPIFLKLPCVTRYSRLQCFLQSFQDF